MRFLRYALLIPLLGFFPHKYYISTTDMYYKPEKQQLQLVVRVFSDDFTTALSAYASKKIKLDADTVSNKEVNTLIHAYFQDHFEVMDIPETGSFSFVGWEFTTDKIILYASFDHLGEISHLEWSNTFLMEAFPDQKNIVILSTSDQKKSFLHTTDKNVHVFHF